MLRAQGLHKSFGVAPALRGVDLEVGSGEVLAVTGPSGSGKSTLLHCLSGILTPEKGEVHVDGRRIDRLPDRERSRLRRGKAVVVAGRSRSATIPGAAVASGR